MPQFFIGMYQPLGVVPPPEVLGPVMRETQALMAELDGAGSLVLANGFDPDAPIAVMTSDGTTMDGTFLPGDVQLGGITVVDVEDDTAARDVARRMAVITKLPIEIRRFQARG